RARVRLSSTHLRRAWIQCGVDRAVFVVYAEAGPPVQLLERGATNPGALALEGGHSSDLGRQDDAKGHDGHREGTGDEEEGSLRHECPFSLDRSTFLNASGRSIAPAVGAPSLLSSVVRGSGAAGGGLVPREVLGRGGRSSICRCLGGPQTASC